MAINVTINEQTINAKEGQTILEAAQDHGITIPTLCYHKDLSPVGSCRLCLVEVDKWRGQIAACTTQVAQDMIVRTETPALIQSRRLVLEMLLQNYVDAGYASGDEKHDEFMAWVRHYQVALPEGSIPAQRYRVDSDPNPFLWVDLNKCILCTRCVRVCSEVEGANTWGLRDRGSSTLLIADLAGPWGESLTCTSCGKCVQVCPTGALFEKGKSVAEMTKRPDLISELVQKRQRSQS